MLIVRAQKAAGTCYTMTRRMIKFSGCFNSSALLDFYLSGCFSECERAIKHTDRKRPHE
jgi:hypothetical protein